MDAPSAFQPPVPGREHHVFTKDVGTWDAEGVFRMPRGPSSEWRGVMVNRLICGGLWLVSDFKSASSPFEGHGVFGYDPLKKKYVGTWVDPMRTFLAPMEGTWDAEKRTMSFVIDHPPGTWRETTEQVDDNTQIFRVFMGRPGAPEAEVMTITYRRRP